MRSKSAALKVEQENAELRHKRQELKEQISALSQGMAAQVSLQASQAAAALKRQQESDAQNAGLKAELLAHRMDAAQAQKQQQGQHIAMDAKCATLKVQKAAVVAQLDISRQQTIDAQASVQLHASEAAAAQQTCQLLLNAVVSKSAEAEEDARRAQAQLAVLQARIQQLEWERAGWASCVDALSSKLISSDRRCSVLVAALAAANSSLAPASNWHSLQGSADEAQRSLPFQTLTPTHSEDMSAASGSSLSSFVC
jgi:hypothetical protein